MPFTFARWLDPVVQAPTVQTNIVAALMTAGFVKRDKDASQGELWQVMQQWGWITCAHQARDLIFVRRYALRHSARNAGTVMWIGVQLNGRDYRISCDQVFGDERVRLGRLLEFGGLGIGTNHFGDDALDFKARSIRLSHWAARRPEASGTDENAAPPAPIGDILYSNVNHPANQEPLDHNEVVEDEIEINYS